MNGNFNNKPLGGDNVTDDEEWLGPTPEEFAAIAAEEIPDDYEEVREDVEVLEEGLNDYISQIIDRIGTLEYKLKSVPEAYAPYMSIPERLQVLADVKSKLNDDFWC